MISESYLNLHTSCFFSIFSSYWRFSTGISRNIFTWVKSKKKKNKQNPGYLCGRHFCRNSKFTESRSHFSSFHAFVSESCSERKERRQKTAEVWSPEFLRQIMKESLKTGLVHFRQDYVPELKMQSLQLRKAPGKLRGKHLISWCAAGINRYKPF